MLVILVLTRMSEVKRLHEGWHWAKILPSIDQVIHADARSSRIGLGAFSLQLTSYSSLFHGSIEAAGEPYSGCYLILVAKRHVFGSRAPSLLWNFCEAALVDVGK